MSATVTVTGKAGPAIALTAVVINNVSIFKIDCVANILTCTLASGAIDIIDITAATTITATKSSSTYTLTIS
jgi:hypothetical protein